MEQLISIIVPVYNTGEYLAPCIESLITQTYRNLDIILVDDGSTDGSSAVCDEFARRDSRIHVLHQENAGVSAARNAGLDAASGTYLTFVDSDDLLIPQAMELALACLQENDCDMVTYGWMNLRIGDDSHTDSVGNFEICTDPADAIQQMLSHYSAYGGGYPWNKLWRRDASLFGGSIPRFSPDLYYFEDLEWVIRMMLHVRKFAVCPECLYQYRIHGSSVSQDSAKAERRELGYHQSMERIIDSLAVLPDLQNWFSQKYCPEIVNGIIHATKYRFRTTRSYLLQRMALNQRIILNSHMIPGKVKIKCVLIHLFVLLRLIT